MFWGILMIGGLTGLFKEIMMLFFIVFVHEMGHSLMAAKFKWRLRKIMLLPFGGMAETDEYGNRPVHEEILVVICGPLQHVWMIAGSYLLTFTPLWSDSDHHIFFFHNITILLFNLLPILPLDGGRLLFSLQTYFQPFYQAYYTNFYVSLFLLLLLTLLSLVILPFHLNLIIVVFFLWLHHYLEWKQRHFMFLRFLLERLRDGPFGDKKIVRLPPNVSVAGAMKKVSRQRHHYFILPYHDVYLDETVVLEAFFDEKKRFLPLGKLR
ncbi:stage IV sporulation protein FB [Evansella caseinilytica]|uniref:Stage IV sporulation protein FB n=1 Tax=Evansella caseinilytica TaxID=1503961 RepID=A0A1H3PS36_9BACI|nr:stage IV sporulation protein FB [Evansella caseinilytica]